MNKQPYHKVKDKHVKKLSMWWLRLTKKERKITKKNFFSFSSDEKCWKVILGKMCVASWVINVVFFYRKGIKRHKKRVRRDEWKKECASKK